MLKRHCSACWLVCLSMMIIFMFAYTIVGCGGGGGGGGGAGSTTYTINANGGDGGITGADGGVLQIIKNGGSAPVEVLRSGSVDAGFSPTNATPDLGANPLSITADTTILVATVGPALDTPYLVTTDDSLRISDGDATIGDELAVTGLSVASGTTLTLALNAGLAEIAFTNDIENNGTITTQDVDALQRGRLELHFANFHSSRSSQIDTSGHLPGQRGGDINLSSLGGSNVAVYNQGRIDSSGADNAGGGGGSGGSIIVRGFTFLENSGTIACSGGTGETGAGGTGGSVNIESGVGHLFNSGDIHAQGGDGNVSGGLGGIVMLNSAIVSSGGELRNTGAIDVSGGDSSGGNGGFAASIRLEAFGGDLANSASLTAVGGSTSHPTSDGSGGGLIILNAFPHPSSSTPAGSGQVAGNINCSGGHAVTTGSGNGGPAGAFIIQIDASGSLTGRMGLPAPTTQQLSLLGYSAINATGGSGNNGGSGGSIVLNNSGERWDTGSSFVDDPSGDTINEAAITANGGSLAPGGIVFQAIGGSGGLVYLFGDPEIAEINPTAERVINSGDISVRGGDSIGLLSSPGQNGGLIQLYTTNAVTNSGTLTCNGGSDSINDNNLTSGFGHDAGTVALFSVQATTTNSGAIQGNGGEGEAEGGIGGGLVLGNVQVVNSANVSLLGGNADTTLSGSIGGDGGYISVTDADTPDLTGTLNVSGGAGDTAGADGTITP